VTLSRETVAGVDYYTIQDDSATITASGCVPENEPVQFVRCRAPGVRTITVFLEDGRDTLTIQDSVYRSNGTDAAITAHGGPGDDDLLAALGAETLDGDEGADRIEGGGGADAIDGGAGDDGLLDGGPGEDQVSAGSGNDARATGGEGNDVVAGGPGDDGVIGGPGADHVDGGEDADRVDVPNTRLPLGLERPSDAPTPADLAGNDVLDGGPGNDVIGVELPGWTLEPDVLAGGAGSDTVSYESRMTGSSAKPTMCKLMWRR
jgi:Ca2+-binding RTX toxin-like protein